MLKETVKPQVMPFSPGVGCVISFLLVSLPVCLLVAASALVVQRELVLNVGPVRQFRVWLVDAGLEHGLGYSYMSEISNGATPDRRCFETRVDFFLLSPHDIDRRATYCDCYAEIEARWEPVSVCP